MSNFLIKKLSRTNPDQPSPTPWFSDEGWSPAANSNPHESLIPGPTATDGTTTHRSAHTTTHQPYNVTGPFERGYSTVWPGRPGNHWETGRHLAGGRRQWEPHPGEGNKLSGFAVGRVARLEAKWRVYPRLQFRRGPKLPQFIFVTYIWNRIEHGNLWTMILPQCAKTRQKWPKFEWYKFKLKEALSSKIFGRHCSNFLSLSFRVVKTEDFSAKYRNI